MEFLDEDARPRFLLQSRAQPSPNSDSQTQPFNKTLIFISISLSILLISLTFFFVDSEPLKSILLWVASSLILGPFAPISLTAGDIRVGHGPIVEFPIQQDQEKTPAKKTKNNFSNGRHVVNRSQRSEESGAVSVEELKESVKSVEKKSGSVAKMAVEEEKEWSEEDFELLKKQMAKHPVGMPRRWEVITESFRGRHKMENVVKMAKSMPERKLNDGDSFARFLKDRKPLDKRSETGNDELVSNGEKKEKEGLLVWSAEEDIALLNALKAFPKDASMRWEKIAAAVPGKTKNACMKRTTDLKKDFRSSKSNQ